jgi:hypothetical protein
MGEVDLLKVGMREIALPRDAEISARAGVKSNKFVTRTKE